MTVREIEETLHGVNTALRSMKEAEKWAMFAVSHDSTGNAHHAWNHAKRAVADLEKLKRQLQAVRPS